MIDIGVFTPAEARAYLSTKLDEQTPVDDLDGLAADLGYLPLALAQAVAYIHNADITCGAYRERLASRLLAHAVPGEQYLPDGHVRIVTATWQLSIAQAEQALPADRGGLARAVLVLVSVLDPAGIPQAVLDSPPALAYLAASSSPEPVREHEESVDAEVVDDVLRVLHRHSLLDHDRAATYREIRIHQLLQRATREDLISRPDHRPGHLTALARAAADALLEIWPDVERDGLGQVLRANTTALQQAAGPALFHNNAHQVLFEAVHSLGEAGHVHAAATACTDLVTSAARHLGPKHPDTLTARLHLAHWQGRAGDAAGATAALEKLLPIVERVFGRDHPCTLGARHNQAFWQGESGDAAGARAALEELLPIVERVFGRDHPNTLADRVSLARWCGEAGDAARAAADFKALLRIVKKVFGSDHPNTLSTRHDLAHWQGKAGDAARAAAALDELLTDVDILLGPDHPSTLTTRYSLAHWLGEAGDAAGAADAFADLLSEGCLLGVAPFGVGGLVRAWLLPVDGRSWPGCRGWHGGPGRGSA
ncbi:tetratricopeptide repeat protein [Actinomadura adrarensis]|uniref:Tetratricopeptide repeat protein n=1 Tax=Actinomadura adrarensis TaxID=1819600 RepID=A0ABW3C8Q8_9ACTN